MRPSIDRRAGGSLAGARRVTLAASAHRLLCSPGEIFTMIGRR
jgi:hypothetical protein